MMQIIGLGIDLSEIHRVDELLTRYYASLSDASLNMSRNMPSGSPILHVGSRLVSPAKRR